MDSPKPPVVHLCFGVWAVCEIDGASKPVHIPFRVDMFEGAADAVFPLNMLNSATFWKEDHADVLDQWNLSNVLHLLNDRETFCEGGGARESDSHLMGTKELFLLGKRFVKFSVHKAGREYFHPWHFVS